MKHLIWLLLKKVVCVIISIIYIKINSNKNDNLFIQIIYGEKILNENAFSLYKKEVWKNHTKKSC